MDEPKGLGGPPKGKKLLDRALDALLAAGIDDNARQWIKTKGERTEAKARAFTLMGRIGP